MSAKNNSDASDRCAVGPLQLHTWQNRVCIHCGESDPAAPWIGEPPHPPTWPYGLPFAAQSAIMRASAMVPYCCCGRPLWHHCDSAHVGECMEYLPAGVAPPHASHPHTEETNDDDLTRVDLFPSDPSLGSPASTGGPRAQEDVLSSPLAAGLLLQLKAECEAQHEECDRQTANALASQAAFQRERDRAKTAERALTQLREGLLTLQGDIQAHKDSIQKALRDTEWADKQPRLEFEAIFRAYSSFHAKLAALLTAADPHEKAELDSVPRDA